MRNVIFNTPIIILIVVLSLGIGCDNTSKKDADNGDNGEASRTTEDKNTSEQQFLSIGTGTPQGIFFKVGSAIAGVVSQNIKEKEWEVTAETTQGTQQNIRLLVAKDSTLEFAMANAAISYFAVRGEGAWKTEQPIRAIVTLAPNVALFVTPKSSGIQSMQDLKGKRVVVGPAGAGFEYFLKPVFEEHGLTYDDFNDLNGSYGDAVDMLANKSADAAFMGGALPITAVIRASSSQDIMYIPFEESALQSLFEKYPFFNAETIPAKKHGEKQPEAFSTMNVGSMHIITAENADEDMVYHFTKTLYTHRAKVVDAHPAGKAINEKNAVKDVGTPFHPGAVRFYKEIGIWKE